MSKNGVIEFLESRETYEKVLSILSDEAQSNGSRLDDYHATNFIAGGSVANAIYHLLNPGKFKKPVINDIDIFMFNNSEEHTFIMTNTPQEDNGSLVMGSGYNNSWVTKNKLKARMSNSLRFGLINQVEILVNTNKEINPSDHYDSLLSNFDLNCCSAGLDRENCRIVYTKEFVNFLESDKVEVTSLNQPLQTLIRLKKKIKTLKTDTSNFNDEVDLIKHCGILQPYHHVGPLWFSRASKEIGLLRDIITFEGKSGNGRLSYYKFNTFEVKPFIKFMLSGYWPYSNKDSLITIWDIFVRGRNPKALENLTLLDKTPIRGKIYSDDTALLYQGNVYNGFIGILKSNPTYFESDHSIEELKRVNRFFKDTITGGISFDHLFHVKDVKSQIEVIDFFEKRFIKYNDLDRSLLKHVTAICCFYDYFGDKIKTTNPKDKIKALEYVINSTWIRPPNMKNTFKRLFNELTIHPVKLTNVNDVDLWF